MIINKYFCLQMLCFVKMLRSIFKIKKILHYVVAVSDDDFNSETMKTLGKDKYTNKQR